MSISVSAMKDSRLPQKHPRYSAKAFSLNEKNQELENRLAEGNLATVSHRVPLSHTPMNDFSDINYLYCHIPQ